MVLNEAAKAAAAGRAFVLATVIRAQGSTPRGPGAMMICLPGPATDRSHDSADPAKPGRDDDATSPALIIGTVGGGQFERLVLDDARRMLENPTPGVSGGRVERYVLGAESEQCCGGVVEVFLQAHFESQRVVIFGAGHVSHELVKLLHAAPIRPVVVDDRADWNTEARFPGAQRVLDFDAGVAIARASAQGGFALVMTCCHQTDERLLRALLAGSGEPGFVGLIGSRSKRACLFGRLVASGIDESRVARIRCPIGVGDTGKEPAALAVSIAAQVLIETKRARDARAGVLRRSSASLSEQNASAPASAGTQISEQPWQRSTTGE